MVEFLRTVPESVPPSEGEVRFRLPPPEEDPGPRFRELLLSLCRMPGGRAALCFAPGEEQAAEVIRERLEKELLRIQKAGPAKDALRRAAAERAAALSPAYRRKAGDAIASRLLADERYRKAKRVFLYVSMPREPDTSALLAHALASGKEVYVPKCLGDHVMRAVRIRSREELSPGTLGIPEPPDSGETADAADLDLVIAPCVAADRKGRRLGHGAGYYDAFLFPGTAPVICLCFSRLLLEEVPVSVLDVPVDAVLTENGFC